MENCKHQEVMARWALSRHFVLEFIYFMLPEEAKVKAVSLISFEITFPDGFNHLRGRGQRMCPGSALFWLVGWLACFSPQREHSQCYLCQTPIKMPYSWPVPSLFLEGIKQLSSASAHYLHYLQSSCSEAFLLCL